MTAITADNTNDIQSKQYLPDGFIVDLPVAASTTIYKNSFVGLDSGNTNKGYLVSYLPRVQATTPTGNHFMGLALEHVDNSAGANAAKTCAVQVSGFFKYPLSAAAQLDVGKPVWAADNATLTKVGVNMALVGTIVSVPASGYVVVDMMSPTARMGYGAGFITRTALVDVANVVNDEVFLVFPTENHNGMYLYSCSSVNTEAVVGTSADGVITIVHTLGTDTTLGCTLTLINTSPVSDLIVGAGGTINGPGSASNDNIIPIPADVAVIAKVTTVCAGGTITGQANVCATFALL